MLLSTLIVSAFGGLASAACFQSTVNPSTCIILDEAASVIETTDEARTVNKLYKGDVRVEQVNGTYAMIEDSTSKHIATIGGDALAHLEAGISRSKRDDVEKRQGDCVHNTCAIVSQCGNFCAFCYPVVCI